MTIASILFALALLCVGCQSTKSLELTYMQWNIGHFAMGKAATTTLSPTNAPQRALEYRALLNTLKPDILGINEYEASFDTSGAPSTNIIFHDFPHQVFGPQNSWQWNASFMRKNIEVLRTERIDYSNRWQHTYALIAHCRANNTNFTIAQTHLDWNIDGPYGQCYSNRQDQISTLIKRFADTPRVIISGDFNIASEQEYDAFKKAGYSSINYGDHGELSTFKRKPNSKLASGLDNILVKGFDYFAPFTADPNLLLSDHRPICVRLKAKTDESASAKHPTALKKPPLLLHSLGDSCH